MAAKPAAATQLVIPRNGTGVTMLPFAHKPGTRRNKHVPPPLACTHVRLSVQGTPMLGIGFREKELTKPVGPTPSLRLPMSPGHAPVRLCARRRLGDASMPTWLLLGKSDMGEKLVGLSWACKCPPTLFTWNRSTFGGPWFGPFSLLKGPGPETSGSM